jgi:hypothetical protein
MEAKWSRSLQGMRALNKLRQKAKLVSWMIDDRQEFFVIYSKSGFTNALLDLSTRKDNLLLVHQDKIIMSGGLL